MKRYIKCTTDYNGMYNAYRADRRKLASLDPVSTTYEDLRHIDYESGRLLTIILDHAEEQNVPVDDCIEDLIDACIENMKYAKDAIAKSEKYSTAASQLHSILSDYLDDYYNVIDQTENSWTIEPPANATHQDCIEFADNVKDAINGRYYGTARGGSWTTWDLLSENNVEVKVGWTRDDSWYVEIPNR